mgnify:CR=1 FL=1
MRTQLNMRFLSPRCQCGFSLVTAVFLIGILAALSIYMIGMRVIQDSSAIIDTLGTRAYAAAGVDPADVDVAEVHDATAMGEIIEIEALGLVPPGEGGVAAERGDTVIGGRIPVNPSGGLECKGHPIGATGLGQIYELVAQLRGEAASVGDKHLHPVEPRSLRLAVRTTF